MQTHSRFWGIILTTIHAAAIALLFASSFPTSIYAQSVSSECQFERNYYQIQARRNGAGSPEEQTALARLRTACGAASAEQFAQSINSGATPTDVRAAERTSGKQPAAGCPGGWKNLSKPIDCLLAPGIVYLFGSIIMGASGLALELAGYLFDVLVGTLVVAFASTLGGLGMIEGIHTGWTVLRDISNVVIIGMFTFIAISIIIGNHTFGEKRLVAKVLVVAILINFSLLFAKIIIDSSNFVAWQVYKSMAPSGSGDGAARGVFGTGTGANVSQKFLALVNTTSIFDVTQRSIQANSDPGSASNFFLVNTAKGVAKGVFYSIVGSALLLAAAAVLLYGCYLIAARGVLLVFLMLVSALAFASYLVPSFSDGEYGWKTWWKSLINASIFGPLLMMLLYVSLVILTPINQKVQGGSFANILSNPSTIQQSNSDWQIIIVFIFGIGMLYASLKVANSFAGKIAGFSTAGGIVGKGFGLTMGGAGILGRQTLGWGATKFAQSRAGRALATAPVIGRPMRTALYGAATGAYDPRNIPGMKQLFKATGMAVGDAAKDGYLKSLKGRQKAIKEKEEERVGFFTTKNRQEKKVEAAAKGTQSEAQAIETKLNSDKKAREELLKSREHAAEETGTLKVKANERVKKIAEEAGLPAPAFTEEQTMSETKVRIEEGRRIAMERGDSASADELRIIAERMGELSKTIETADKGIAALDASTVENSKKLTALKPELDKNSTALKTQEQAQKDTLGAFHKSISSEYYGTLFGDRMLSTEVADDVIKSVKKSPDQKHAEHLMHLLHELEHKAHPPAASTAAPAESHGHPPANTHAAPAGGHGH